MSLCALCGLTSTRPGDLCGHHPDFFSDDWATGNRIVCDLIHRGIAPSRLAFEERADDFWAANSEHCDGT